MGVIAKEHASDDFQKQKPQPLPAGSYLLPATSLISAGWEVRHTYIPRDLFLLAFLQKYNCTSYHLQLFYRQPHCKFAVTNRPPGAFAYAYTQKFW